MNQRTARTPGGNRNAYSAPRRTPVAAVTDALLLARIADSTLLVVQQNKVDRAMVKRSLGALRKVTPNVIGAVLNAVDVKASLDNRCLTEGRLNAFMTIAEPDSIAPGAVSDLATANPSSNAMGLTWTATGDDGGTGRASSYEIRRSTSPITDEASFLAATLVPGGPDPQIGRASGRERG